MSQGAVGSTKIGYVFESVSNGRLAGQDEKGYLDFTKAPEFIYANLTDALKAFQKSIQNGHSYVPLTIKQVIDTTISETRRKYQEL